MTCRPAMNSTLTSLERRCLELVAAERWPGFRIDGIRVTLREHTGVGRFVYFQDLNQQILQLVNSTMDTIDLIRGPYGWQATPIASRSPYSVAIRLEARCKDCNLSVFAGLATVPATVEKAPRLQTICMMATGRSQCVFSATTPSSGGQTGRHSLA